MADLLPRHYITGTVIFVLLISGMVALLTQIKTGSIGDGSDAVPDLIKSDKLNSVNTSFNKFAEVANTTNELKGDLKNLQPSGIVDILSLPLAFIQTAWDMVKFLIDSFSFMDDAFQAVADWTGLPEWVGTFMILFVSILLVFSILSLIFGGKL